MTFKPNMAPSAPASDTPIKTEDRPIESNPKTAAHDVKVAPPEHKKS